MKLVVALVLALAVVVAAAEEAAQQTTHAEDVAALAAELPKESAAMAELAHAVSAGAAGSEDAFAILDAIADNIRAEARHARMFYESYQRTSARDIKRYNSRIGGLRGGDKRSKQQLRANRAAAKSLRATVNANVRQLARAVNRFQQVKQDARRTTSKKKSAMRRLNNKIADRHVYRKVLKAIRRALQNNDPAAVRQSAASLIQTMSHTSMSESEALSFLQIAEEASSEETVTETDNSDEAEAEAEIDASAFDMENMPSEEELQEVADDTEADEEDVEALEEADEAAVEADEDAQADAEEEADFALLEENDEDEDELADEDEDESEGEGEDESDEQEADMVETEAEDVLEAEDEADEAEEMDSEDETEDQDEADIEAEAEADADVESEDDAASQARMMEVLSRLAADPNSSDVKELIALIDQLLEDVKAMIANAKKRKIEVLAKYTARMKDLQLLANSIKTTIARLQAAVQSGRARLADLERNEHILEANLKDLNPQAKAYTDMVAGIRSNWDSYEERYQRNQQKRKRILRQIAELKRRLAALERAHGTLNIDTSKVQLRYRWKAYPFGPCGKPCGPSTRLRKVRCLSFSGKPVKAEFCADQKKPKSAIKCQRKACPSDCVLSPWKAKGRCSNACGAGVKLYRRKLLVPAKFGGVCAAKRMTKHVACRSRRGCDRQMIDGAPRGMTPEEKAKLTRSKLAAKSADQLTPEQRAARRERRRAFCAKAKAKKCKDSKRPKRCRRRRARARDKCALWKARRQARKNRAADRKLSKQQRKARRERRRKVCFKAKAKKCVAGPAGRKCRGKRRSIRAKCLVWKEQRRKRREAKAKRAAARADAGVPLPSASGADLTAEERRARRERRRALCRKAKNKKCKNARKPNKCRRKRAAVRAKCAVWKAKWQARKAARAAAMEPQAPAAGKKKLSKKQKKARRARRKALCRKAKAKKCKNSRNPEKCRAKRNRIRAKCAVWKAKRQARKAAAAAAGGPQPAVSGKKLNKKQRKARRARRRALCKKAKAKNCRNGRKGRKCRNNRRKVLAKCAVWKAKWQARKAEKAAAAAAATMPEAAPPARKPCPKGKRGRRCRKRRAAQSRRRRAALARQTELAAAPPPAPTTVTQTPNANGANGAAMAVRPAETGPAPAEGPVAAPVF